ncbi:MAG: uracil permease, partial [Desulfovibrionaceae bacterium]
TLVRAQEDLMEARNLAIVALIVIFGVGGMTFSIGSFRLGGIGLAAVTGVVLNLILPRARSRRKSAPPEVTRSEER